MPREFRRSRQLLGSALALLLIAGAVPAAGLPGAVSMAGAAEQSTRPAKLARIKKLAAEAYVWGLAGEFTWRFAKYNTR